MPQRAVRLIAKLKEAAPGTASAHFMRSSRRPSARPRRRPYSPASLPRKAVGFRSPDAAMSIPMRLFAELFASLASKRGRCGLIVPTGIATDATTAPFFASLISGQRLVQLLDFENREGLFPAVHRTYKFSLLTLARKIPSATFAFFLSDPSQVGEAERRFSLTAQEIARINPNSLTSPLFRSRVDAETTKEIYRRVPVLITENETGENNPWKISTMRLFHMADDSGLFRTAAQLEKDGGKRSGQNWITADHTIWLPLYEAKMMDQYDHRYADYSKRGGTRGHRVLPELSTEEHKDPGRFAEPFYWIEENSVELALGADFSRRFLFGYGRATTATTSRTMVGTIFPVVGAGDKITIVHSRLPTEIFTCFIANVNAMVLDYVCRQKISYLTLSQFIFRQLPFLPPSTYTPDQITFIKQRVLELSYTANDLRGFADELGYDGQPFSWNPERRSVLRAELDAYFAYMYGLTRDQLRYILDPEAVYWSGISKPAPFASRRPTKLSSSGTTKLKG